MKIAFVASEAVPFAKTGGLADVCGALPLELGNLGHEVVLILPRYQAVRSSGVLLRPLDNHFDQATIEGKLKVYFVKHDMYLREGLYGDQFGDYSDNLKRFAYLSQKSLELLKKVNFVPDVIHCHDWQSSLVPLYLSAFSEKLFGNIRPKTLLTVHNVSYQGIFPKEEMPETGLSWDYFNMKGLEFYDKINLLKGGIEYADLVNTVSPTHALEMRTEEFGCGLEGVLKGRAKDFSGVTNGIDYKVWNPQGDSFIFKPFSFDRIEGKLDNKRGLQEFCQFSKNHQAPLCGFVGRLVEQKGIDAILEVLPRLIEEGFQFVFLGKGEARYEEALTRIAGENPTQVYFSAGFNDPLAHKIYASSDLFLMPSRFEPCGIGQLISFKYGTIPVVFKTGGLADTVQDYHFKKRTGTGFVFSRYEPQEFLLSILRARDVLDDPQRRQELIQRIMCLNFSWKESAKEYVALYQRLKKK